MKLQTFHCEIGDHDWQRPSQRGRPPKICPECADSRPASAPKSALKPLPPELVPYLDPKYKTGTHEEEILHFCARSLDTGVNDYGGIYDEYSLKSLLGRANEILGLSRVESV